VESKPLGLLGIKPKGLDSYPLLFEKIRKVGGGIL